MAIDSKKQIVSIVIALLALFTFTGCEKKKQIQLLSERIVELEESSKDLNSKAVKLQESNERLNKENAEHKKNNDNLNSELLKIRKSNEELSSENGRLNSDNQKLKESANKLQKENTELKKKLEAAEEKKQAVIPKETGKTAYLTFDDGPSDNTIKILDILKANNIKATFFVNGRPDRKALYKRMINDGHTIGNHTYSHDYAVLYKTINGFDKDKQKLDNFIFGVTGCKPQILRFPGGSNNHVSYKYGGTNFMDSLTKHVKQSGIKYFDWNVDSTDASAQTQSKDKIISAVLNGSKNKKQLIILMHDSKPKTTTVQALPSIIKGLKMQGFKFSKLSSSSNAVQFK